MPMLDSDSLQDNMQDEIAGKSKEIIEKVKAALLVWKHTNSNKTPEIEDLVEMLIPKNQEHATNKDPRLLSFKVYVGKTDSPLFYKDPTTNAFFDTQQKNWIEQRPEMIDHLNERDIQSSDVFDAILHGVVDDKDYECLEKVNLIDHRSKSLWSKLNQLRQQTQLMQKSIEDEEVPEKIEIDEEAKQEIIEHETAEEPKEEFIVAPTEERMPGSNILQLILEIAHKNAANAHFTEENIRQMIRDEIQSLMNEHSKGIESANTYDQI